MSTSTLTPRAPQRAAPLPAPADRTILATVRAAFGRLRGMFGPAYESGWASSLQTEHLFACATGEETTPAKIGADR